MKIITGDKGTGKTVALIQESAKTKAYIVVSDRHHAAWVERKAHEMGLKIPFPLTYDEFLDGRANYGRGMKYAVLIDDVNLLLLYLARSIPIDGFSVTISPKDNIHLTSVFGSFDYEFVNEQKFNQQVRAADLLSCGHSRAESWNETRGVCVACEVAARNMSKPFG
jgi:hypothetical protein